MTKTSRIPNGSHRSGVAGGVLHFRLTPHDSPLLCNGPVGAVPVSERLVKADRKPIQPVDVSPTLLTHGDEQWYFSEHARSLLQSTFAETKLLSFSNVPTEKYRTPSIIAQNCIYPSVSNDTCQTTTLTTDSAYSLSTIASPYGCSHGKHRGNAHHSETDDDKCHQDQDVSNRPATPELQVPREPDDFFGTSDGSTRCLSANGPVREPRPQRSTSYLGVSYGEGGRDQSGYGLVPKKYRFDDEKQAYVHEDGAVEATHNMPCAVNSIYEPSSTSMNVSKYYLTMHQKQAAYTRRMFHGLRSHLHKFSLDSHGTIDIIQVKTSAGDRRLHRDVMSPWVQPSKNYPNSDIYDKYRTFYSSSLFTLDTADLEIDKEDDRQSEREEFQLQANMDLRRHDVKDVDFFLCFLYGHIKKEEVTTANIGALSIMSFDCGLFRLHQVMEQITRDHILPNDPLAVMEYAVSTEVYWLHVAAFDYITSNFYYYKNDQHFDSWTTDEIEIYVKSDKLRLKSEFDVFVVIMDWLAIENKANILHASRLLNCIRFFRMTTAEIYKCLSLNAQSDIFDFSQMQNLLTVHLLIQDYIKQGEDTQLRSAIPRNRVVDSLAHWDPRQLYADLPEAQIYLRMTEPFVQETIVETVLIEERQARELQEATELAEQTRAKQEDKTREEEDRCKKLFEMMGVCMDGRSQQTVNMLKTKELQALIPFLEPIHARWPWPGPPSDGGKLDHQKDALPVLLPADI